MSPIHIVSSANQRAVNWLAAQWRLQKKKVRINKRINTPEVGTIGDVAFDVSKIRNLERTTQETALALARLTDNHANFFKIITHLESIVVTLRDDAKSKFENWAVKIDNLQPLKEKVEMQAAEIIDLQMQKEKNFKEVDAYLKDASSKMYRSLSKKIQDEFANSRSWITEFARSRSWSNDTGT